MFKNANKLLLVIALLMLIAIIVPIIVIPNSVVSFISGVYGFITTDLAWLSCRWRPRHREELKGDFGTSPKSLSTAKRRRIC